MLCIQPDALSDMSPGLKGVMYSTGCTSLTGISHINQGNVVFSNVTVYEMFLAALEKNLQYFGKTVENKHIAT